VATTRQSVSAARAQSPQHRFQFKECAQQFVRMDDVALTVASVGVNDPAPAISGNGAAIAHDQPAAESLSAMISKYLIGGMMPEFASPVQEPQTTSRM